MSSNEKDMALIEDNALIEAIILKDEPAFKEFRRRHTPVVRGTAKRILRFLSDADLDEIEQEVFKDIWEKCATFEHRSTVTTWIVSITRNKTINLFRGKTKQFSKAEDPQKVGELIDANRSPTIPDSQEHQLSLAEQYRALEGALNNLSEESRTVLRLSYWEDLSHSEIAERLGISLGMVKHRVAKALGELRRNNDVRKYGLLGLLPNVTDADEIAGQINQPTRLKLPRSIKGVVLALLAIPPLIAAAVRACGHQQDNPRSPTTRQSIGNTGVASARSPTQLTHRSRSPIEAAQERWRHIAATRVSGLDDILAIDVSLEGGVSGGSPLAMEVTDNGEVHIYEPPLTIEVSTERLVRFTRDSMTYFGRRPVTIPDRCGSRVSVSLDCEGFRGDRYVLLGCNHQFHCVQDTTNQPPVAQTEDLLLAGRLVTDEIIVGSKWFVGDRSSNGTWYLGSPSSECWPAHSLDYWPINLSKLDEEVCVGRRNDGPCRFGPFANLRFEVMSENGQDVVRAVVETPLPWEGDIVLQFTQPHRSSSLEDELFRTYEDDLLNARTVWCHDRQCSSTFRASETAVDMRATAVGFFTPSQTTYVRRNTAYWGVPNWFCRGRPPVRLNSLDDLPEAP